MEEETQSFPILSCIEIQRFGRSWLQGPKHRCHLLSPQEGSLRGRWRTDPCRVCTQRWWSWPLVSDLHCWLCSKDWIGLLLHLFRHKLELWIWWPWKNSNNNKKLKRWSKIIIFLENQKTQWGLYLGINISNIYSSFVMEKDDIFISLCVNAKIHLFLLDVQRNVKSYFRGLCWCLMCS